VSELKTLYVQNISDNEVYIMDLKTPVKLQPGQYVDLLKFYTYEELNKSKSLKRALQDEVLTHIQAPESLNMDSEEDTEEYEECSGIDLETLLEELNTRDDILLSKIENTMSAYIKSAIESVKAEVKSIKEEFKTLQIEKDKDKDKDLSEFIKK
jgi:protein subunit release factor A